MKRRVAIGAQAGFIGRYSNILLVVIHAKAGTQ